MRTKRKWWMMCLCAGLLAGCSAANAAAFQTVSVEQTRAVVCETWETDADVAAVSEKINLFSLELMQKAEAETCVLSPASAYLALCCVMDGASGEARAQLEEKLVPAGMPADRFYNACEKIAGLLAEQGTCTFATLLCAQQGAQVNTAFAERIKRCFAGETATVDYKNARATEAINHWAKEKTQGLIEELFSSPLPKETRLVLAGSLSFKDAWQKQFLPENTEKQIFYGSGEETSVLMMKQGGSWAYYEDERMQAVRMGFESGAYMDILLPKGENTPQDILACAGAISYSRREGTLCIPQLDLAHEQDLKEILAEMGMSELFQGGIDGILDEELYLSEAKQNARIRWDENGAEAAAVTVLGMETAAMPTDEPFAMTVDRPFAYAVYPGIGSCDPALFMGVVCNMP